MASYIHGKWERALSFPVYKVDFRCFRLFVVFVLETEAHGGGGRERSSVRYLLMQRHSVT